MSARPRKTTGRLARAFEGGTDLRPGALVGGVRFGIGEPPVELGTLFLGDGNRSRLSDDAVPDGLNKLNSFRNRETKRVLENWSGHAEGL